MQTKIGIINNDDNLTIAESEQNMAFNSDTEDNNLDKIPYQNDHSTDTILNISISESYEEEEDNMNTQHLFGQSTFDFEQADQLRSLED